MDTIVNKKKLNSVIVIEYCCTKYEHLVTDKLKPSDNFMRFSGNKIQYCIPLCKVTFLDFKSKCSSSFQIKVIEILICGAYI